MAEARELQARSLIDAVRRKTNINVGIDALAEVLERPGLKRREIVHVDVDEVIAKLTQANYLPNEQGEVKATPESKKKGKAKAAEPTLRYEPGDPKAVMEPSTRRGVQFELQSARPRWSNADDALFAEMRELRQQADDLRTKYKGKPFRVKPKQILDCESRDGDHFRRGDKKYADPLVEGAWIYIGKRDYQDYLIEKTRQLLMVSDAFKRRMRDRILKLSLLKKPTCIDCGEELMNGAELEQWAFGKAVEYINHHLRLPGDRGGGVLLEPPVSHDECDLQVTELTEIVKAYMEAHERHEGDNKKMAKALSSLQEDADRVWRSAFGTLAPNVPPKEREEFRETVKRRAKVIIDRLEEKLEAAGAIT